jgi:hypothetical protein
MAYFLSAVVWNFCSSLSRLGNASYIERAPNQMKKHDLHLWKPAGEDLK